MKKTITLAALTLLCCNNMMAQESEIISPSTQKKPVPFQKLYVGPGIGLTYGGIIGLKAEYVLPIKHLSVFGGVGYYFSGPGYTVGLTAKLLPNSRFSPLLYGMYGSNAVINITGASQYNKIYAGPSAGIGADLKVGRNGNKLFFGIQYGFWHPDFKKDLEYVKNQPGIEMYTDPIPIGYNFGINFALKSSAK